MGAVLRRAWNGWKKVARAIGVFQTRLILALFYWSVLLPFGVASRFLADPLGLKRSVAARRVSGLSDRPPGRTGWNPRRTRDRTLADLARQD